MRRRSPISTCTNNLFPYTTLFRSRAPVARRGRRSPGRRCEGGGVQCWRRCLRLGAFDRARLMEKDGILMPDGDALTPSRYARSRAYRWYAVGVLMLIYMCHAVDRSMPSILTEPIRARSTEHTSELQSLMRLSYPVFFLKKNK